MSVLLAFGENLRNLTSLRGSQTAVAEKLGISRVQYQRYLRSESFPKPNVLKRICDYFGVDARIMTDLLTDEQLAVLQTGHEIRSTIPSRSFEMQEAIAFACPDQRFFEPSMDLPDGLYQRWRGAKSRLDSALVTVIQIKTLGSARVIRGYDFRGQNLSGTSQTGRQREWRGVILRSQVGYVALMFHSEPGRYVTMSYFKPIDLSYRCAAVGFTVLARDQLPNHARATRTLMIRLDDDLGVQLRAARQSGFVKWQDVPLQILTHIKPQKECF